VAKEFNLKFEDMIALVATLQDVGIEASMSGTQLKTMLTKLATLTPKAAKGFRKIGFEAATAGKNMKQAPKLLAHLYTALLNTKGNMQKVATIADAVGLRGAIAASVLATAWGKGERGIQGLLRGIGEEAEGAAAKMNFLRQDQLAGDITRASSAWNDFRITLGKTQMPKLRGLVQDLTAALKDPEIIQQWVTRLEAVVENLETIFRQNVDVVEATGGLGFTIAKVFGRLGGAAWNMIAHTRWIIGTVAKLFTWVLERLMDWMDSLNATGLGLGINSLLADINETDPTRAQPIPMSSAATESSQENWMGTITIENNSGSAIGAYSESAGMSFDVVTGLPSGDFND
jgi:hypothetical protein